MEVKEAIKNLEKEMKCRTEECLGQCQSCPYFLNRDALVESLQTVIEHFKGEKK